MRLNRGTAVFIALLAIVIIVAAILLQTEDEAADTTPAADAETVDLFPDVLAADVTALSVQAQQTPAEDATPEPEATAEADATTAEPEIVVFSVTQDDGGAWVLAEDSTLESEQPVVQGDITSAISTLINLSTDQSFVPESGDYAQYGLEMPLFDVRFTATSGDEDAQNADYRLRLGEPTLSGTEIYALLNDDDETVYIVSSVSLQRNVLDLVENPPFAQPPTPTPTPRLNVPGEIFAGFNLQTATRFTLTDNENGETLELVKADDGFTWERADAESGAPLDVTRTVVYLTEFSSIRGAARADADDLDALGLNPPRYVFEAEDASGRTYRLQVGATDPTGALYYALVDDFETVVLVEGGTLAPFIELATDPPLAPEVTPETTAEPETTEAPDNDE